MCTSMDLGKYRPHNSAKLIIGVQDETLLGGICFSGILGQYFLRS